MTLDVCRSTIVHCTVRGHVVSAGSKHELRIRACFEPANMTGTPAARDRITRAYAFRPEQAAQ